MIPLRFLTWNVNGAAGERATRLIALLADEVSEGPALAALQEVKPATFESIESAGVFDWTVFSLDIRRAGKFDSGNRELGCVIAGRGPVRLLEGDVLWRLPLPERSVVATIERDGVEFDAISYHSLTGTGFRAGKGIAFRALLETLDSRERPMLLGLDANTPKIDHPDEARSVYWRTPHEELVFSSGREHDLADAYRQWLAENPDEFNAIVAERPDGPLAITHLRGDKDIPCRYDQIWVSPEWRVEGVQHLTDESFEAGSDHAMVSAKLDLC